MMQRQKRPLSGKVPLLKFLPKLETCKFIFMITHQTHEKQLVVILSMYLTTILDEIWTYQEYTAQFNLSNTRMTLKVRVIDTDVY